MDDFEKDFINQGKKENTPRDPPKESKPEFNYSNNRRAIEDKKAELELRKLEIEMDKLTQPATSIDYFQKMLELQQQHNNTLLQMQKENFTTQLEIEKLKLGDGGEDWIKDLLPLLPSLLQQRGITPTPQNLPATSNLLTESGDITLGKPKIPEQKKSKKGVISMMAKEEVDAYVQRIKDGKIEEEEAFKKFKEQMPEYADKMPRNNFHKWFEDIKKGKAKL